MGNWFFSLQFRLIAGFALVLALALGSVSLYIGFAAEREVERIQRQTDDARASRIERTLSQFYSANHSWAGLQSMIERAGFLSGREIVVVDEDGRIVGDTRAQHDNAEAPVASEAGFSPILIDGRQAGSVLIGHDDVWPRIGFPRRAPGRFAPDDVRERFKEPSLTRFADAINQSLILAGIAAGAGGILLVSLTSRRVLASVRELNSAARALGIGDLSQRVPARGRDEIGELGRTFNSMATDLESAEAQRRSTVADVAHELRTPLSNILGYTEALRDGLLEPDSSTLTTLHQQVMYLSRLVGDLRLLAETEAQDFQLNREPDSLDDVIRRSVEAFRPKAEAEGVAVVMKLPSELPLIEFDRTRIAQVLGNLLENAIRHTPSGGRVTVSATVDDSRASVTVADSGEGISSEAIPHVFERFYRVDPSRSRVTGGAGLGLTIAKQLVEAHGGSIRADSTAGKGSRFVFDLPLQGESI